MSGWSAVAAAAIVMVAVWQGLAWLVWRKSPGARATFPSGSMGLFRAVSLALFPWAVLIPLAVIAQTVARQTFKFSPWEGGLVTVVGSLAVFALLEFAVPFTRGWSRAYWRFRAAQTAQPVRAEDR